MANICLLFSICAFIAGVASLVSSLMILFISAHKCDVIELKKKIFELELRVDKIYKNNS
jgi:hypothetical protein